MELDISRVGGTASQVWWQPAGLDDRLPEPVHFIGIGGIGMSALARLLLARGVKVSGSDRSESPITDELQEMGASIYVGHRADNVEKAGSVVVSTAITEENPELARARALGLPVLHRSAMLSYLCGGHRVIAISGTHGKTTTTGMVSQILLDAGLDPSLVVGGIFERIGSNAHAGKGTHFVMEADESDRTHAGVTSEIAVITNIECDHLENYPGGFKQILEVMACFANNSNRVVLCADDKGCRELIPLLKKAPITYGSKALSPEADWTVEETAEGYSVHGPSGTTSGINMSVPGFHNMMNALSAIAVAHVCGVPVSVAAEALSEFRGVDRRFQILGETNGILVVDDYGHHPTEVKATLEAAQNFRVKKFAGTGRGRVVAVFQPHQPGRLRDLWTEFTQAFASADLVLLADIYIARGKQIEGVTSEIFARAIKNQNVQYLEGPASGLPEKIAPNLRPDDIVLTIGAGDITNVGKPLLQLLSRKNGK